MNTNSVRGTAGYTHLRWGPIKCKICKRGFLFMSDLQKHQVKHYRRPKGLHQFNWKRTQQLKCPTTTVEEKREPEVRVTMVNHTSNSKETHFNSPLQKDSGIDDCSPLSYEGYNEQGKSEESVQLKPVYPPCPQPQVNQKLVTPTVANCKVKYKDMVIDLTAETDENGEMNTKCNSSIDFTAFLIDNHNEDDFNTCTTCEENNLQDGGEKKEYIREKATLEIDLEKPTYLQDCGEKREYIREQPTLEIDLEKPTNLQDCGEKREYIREQPTLEIDLENPKNLQVEKTSVELSLKKSSYDECEKSSVDDLLSLSKCTEKMTSSNHDEVEKQDYPLDTKSNLDDDDDDDDEEVFIGLNSSNEIGTVDDSEIMDEAEESHVISVDKCGMNESKNVDNVVCNAENTEDNISIDDNDIHAEERTDISCNSIDLDVLVGEYPVVNVTEGIISIANASKTDEKQFDPLEIKKQPSVGNNVKGPENVSKSRESVNLGTNKVINSLFEMFSTTKLDSNRNNKKSGSPSTIDKVQSCDKVITVTDSKPTVKDTSLDRNIFDLLSRETTPIVSVGVENIIEASENSITIELSNWSGGRINDVQKPLSENIIVSDSEKRLSGRGNDFESATGESQFNFYDATSVEIPKVTDDVIYSDCYLGDPGHLSSQCAYSSSQHHSDSDGYSHGPGDTPSKYVVLSQDTNISASQTPIKDMLQLESDMDSSPVKSVTCITPSKTQKKPEGFQSEFAKFVQNSGEKGKNIRTSKMKRRSVYYDDTELESMDYNYTEILNNVPNSFITSSKSHFMSSRQEKSLFTSHQKLITLRRKVCKLLHNVFPGIEFPKYFKSSSSCVEAVLDQIISIIKTPDLVRSQKMQAIPTENSCYEVKVVLCKSPRLCIKHLRKKIVRLLKNVLPELKLSPNFDTAGEMVDELLKKVILFNDPNKKVNKQHHTKT